MGALLDASILIDILDGEEDAVLLADRLDERREPVVIPTPAVYEIETGIRYAGARSQAKRFQRSLSRFPWEGFDEEAAEEAAGLRAELLELGRVKSHPDVMIAGIALANDHRLVTQDEDFEEIADVVGLEVETLN